MKILFLGDVVGKPGRCAIRDLLPEVVQKYAIDVVVANGENAAGGSGLNVTTAGELFRYGVQIITLGDHTWNQKDLPSYIQKEERIIRPANYPQDVPGRGSLIYDKIPFCPPLGVINLQGRTFMQPMDDPFKIGMMEILRVRESTPIILVDFHAEATSEKIAFSRYVDGKVSAVVGTHTHVQTADEKILPGGTAFLCDAGFTGPHDSVIGREVEPVLKRFLTGMPQRFDVANHDVRLQGVFIEVDNDSGKATRIERVDVAHPSK